MAEETERPQTSTRDYDELHRRLTDWLTSKLPGRAPELSALEIPTTNGMSSETVLFDVKLAGDDGTESLQCVARLAPPHEAVPVFPVSDLPTQYATMQLVAERTAVPVPRPLWVEPDPGPIGTAFFVMERVHGVPAPDLMPYPFGDNWLYDASRFEQQKVQSSLIEVLAQVHTIAGDDPAAAFLHIDRPEPTPLRRHLAAEQDYYAWVVSDGERVPLLERALRWLEDNLPAETDPVVCWGDARIGNVLFRDFEPVAVLDWEMAVVAPREVDLLWGVYMHRFFDDFAQQMGLPGMPHYLRRDDVAGAYEKLTGYTPRHLDWYGLYCALRYGTISVRIHQRSRHFGQAEPLADPDDAVMHRAGVEAMLTGTYW